MCYLASEQNKWLTFKKNSTELMYIEMEDYLVRIKLDFYRILIGTGRVNTLIYYKEIQLFPLLSFIIPI